MNAQSGRPGSFNNRVESYLGFLTIAYYNRIGYNRSFDSEFPMSTLVASGPMMWPVVSIISAADTFELDHDESCLFPILETNEKLSASFL